jgi:hypothetical protein
MIGIVKRYICDACNRQECVGEHEESSDWTHTEVGDLCPSCARAWEGYKKSFIDRMRKDNGENLV